MSDSFTARDILATSIAFVLFPLLIVIPGYVLGALLDLFAFSRRTLLASVAISVSLSVAVVPITVYLCWRTVPAVPWLLCAASWLALPAVLARKRRQGTSTRAPISKHRTIVLTILAGWVVLGTLCLIDIQIGHRLYFPIVSYDYTLRAAFTAAIERTGVPPTNPYFFPGHGYVMRYHYFWYMLCSLVERFGGPFVTARIAVIAGTLWSGIGLVALVALYVRFFQSNKHDSPDKRMLVAVALLSVTGLDILPLLITYFLSGRFNASSDWWNELVLSWVNSVFWQPHSVAALVACATGFLVLWNVSHSGKRAWLTGAVVGGFAFASGLGLSIYVTFVFGIFLMTWMVALLFRGRRHDATVIFIAGVIALFISIPYLYELFGQGSGSFDKPLKLTIRSFYFAEALVDAFHFGGHWQIPLANALSLPLNYFLELGFFFVVGVRQWKSLRRQSSLSDKDVCGIAMLAASIMICTFLRSTTISNNDLGWRGMMVAQFVLLLWAAELWETGLFPEPKARFSAVAAMLALGVAATLYDVTMLRIYPMLLDNLAIPRYHWLAPDRRLGERTFALRQVYEKLSRELPKRALVQQNPNGNPGDLFYGLYADRQTAAETPACGVVFGGSAALCPGIIKPIGEFFDGSVKLDSSQVDLACRKLNIAALVVKDTDSVWRDKTSWVWVKEPLIANAYSRAFLCGTGNDRSTKLPAVNLRAGLLH